MPNLETLTKPLEFFRSGIEFADQPGDVKRDGGDKGAGVIYGVSMITVGEALGHGLFCDEEFLGQVVEAMNNEESGLKARFTHPGACSDGMGKFLGRFKDAVFIDGKVLADLHFSESAHETPDGNLAEYVMKLAETDPDMFGTSIVFSRDHEAEEQFEKDNTKKSKGKEYFESPHEANENNLLHCRLLKLRACDIVDTPAANPDGLFSQSSGADFTKSIDAFAEYIFSVNQDRPDSGYFQFDPDRAKAYFADFMDRHDLKITTKGVEMTTNNTPEEKPVENYLSANFEKFTTEFGNERGNEYLKKELSFEQALQEELKFTKSELDSKSKETGELKNKIESLNEGEKKVKYVDLFSVK